ncbi:MaoC family dehydratase [Sphingorhabdus sp.]|jgi:acyl dehydratase|uniref:MaoC family dehydratase n=1 Tax=Sphingorhabdus sp. TaxID=1902408 RepID=UPI0037C68030
MSSGNEISAVIGRGKYWQELEIGTMGRTLRRTVTETDLVNFVSVTGMLEAIFIDSNYPGAAIKGRLVPAALTQCLIEGMLFQTAIQGVGLALLEISTKAHHPVFVNDSIWAVIDTIEIKPTSKNNRAVVTSKVAIFNQESILVLSYVVKRLVAGRADAELASLDMPT